MADGRRAAVYSRVSTDEQALRGTSLAEQWERASAFARARGATHVDRFEDAGRSGASLVRPALAALRAAVAAGKYDLVVVTDPDRLARRLVDQLLLTDEIARRAELAFVQFDWQDTADGRLFYAVRGAVAEFEREKIRQRTLTGRLRAAAAGRIVAVPHQAYGYAYDRPTRRLRPVASEAVVVREIYRRCIDADWGSARIAAHLNGLGIAARHGGRWHPEGVRRILRNPLYMGRLRQFGRLVAAPALVEERRWRHAQRALDARRGRRPGRARHPYLLRGMVRCALCGGPYAARAAERAGRHRYYACTGRRRGRCGARPLPAPDLERAVWRAVRRVLTTPLATAHPAPDGAGASARAQAPVVLAALARERDRLLRLVRRGVVAADEAAHQLAEIERSRTLAQTDEGRAPRSPASLAARPRPGPAERLEARRALLLAVELEVVVGADASVCVRLALPPP
jgi:site-specific DNA recombinase